MEQPSRYLMSRGSTPGFLLLILYALLLGTASPAAAAEKFCSDPPYFGVIDGDIRPVPTQITVDRDCTFKNFPQSNPLTSTINFHTNDPSIYLIIFENVYYTGNMACANVNHRIWFANSSYYGSNNACQDLFIPVETIDKKNPAGQTTALVGVPFTYTLTLPAMSLGGGPSFNDLHSVILWDDLTATATGADLTYLSNTAYLVNGGTTTPLGSLINAGDNKHVEFNKTANPALALIPTGSQIVIHLTVVLDNTARNAPGTQFVNTAKWQFGRLIDGVYYEPLPGEWGRTEPMTIVRPDLVVTKTGPTSVINLGQWAAFTIDVWNRGPSSGDAWNVNIVDLLPSNSSNPINGGMCDLTPEVTGVTLAGAPLTLGTDYSLSYAGCQLSLALLGTADRKIGTNEHLLISYRTKVDADSLSGAVLTNVAAATQWSSEKDGTTGQTYACTPTDGTVGVDDCQDAHNLLVALSGYFFEKTAANPATGAIVSTAQAGETLRYTLSLRSIDRSFTGLRFHDVLNRLNPSPAFVPGSLSLVSYPAGADVSQTGNGILDIRNLSVPAGGVIEVKFDITLASTLNEGFVVRNQADLFEGAVDIGNSDDPNINGQADPAVAGDEDPTRVVIAFPAPLPPAKALVSPTIAEATIGQEVSYEIRVPGTVSTRPLYDVVVTDTLDANLEYLGFAQTSGPAVTDNSVAPNLSFRVGQIPAGQQAVFTVRARVRNVLGAQQGIAINNAASYAYANTSGGATQPALTSGTVTLHVVEPHITSITKSANPTTPAAGETVRYSVTLTASGTTFSSDVFDVTITDTLGLGLVYAGNPTVTVGGGVSANNTIGAPVISGDSINQAQTLLWSLNNGNADIDIAEGTSVTISYDVRMLSGVLAQAIANSAVAQWTGIDGPNAFERNGTDGIGGLNDYVTAPATATIGNQPLLYAHKTAQIYPPDTGSPGIVDPGDVLRYTIVLSNSGAVPATGVVLTDNVPANTTYVADSLRLNGAPVGTDGGVSPLIAGLPVQSADHPGAGIVSAGNSAVVTFEARVNDGVPTGTLIVNQGRITSGEMPPGATDADGVPSNGNQPTIVVVGAVQLLSLTKEVSAVGGGIAEAGGQLEYVIRVNNIGSLPATGVVVTDDLNPPLGNQVTYVAGSGTLNDSTDGVVYAGGVLTVDYAARYGDLPPGTGRIVRFRVQINSAIAIGTTITNTAVVRWNDPAQTETASVSIDVGGTPGSANLNGNVWHDANLNKVPDNGTETMMEGWSVELYRNNQSVTTALTDANGFYRFSGLAPNAGTSDLYELRFRAPGAGPTTASMGTADSPFINGPQRISGITVASGANLQNLNLPLWPNGTVYNSVSRVPVAGAGVAMLNAATKTALPGQCFDDPVQQNQVTAANGFYKFDLNFSDASCPAGGGYLIEVTRPPTGYMDTPSRIISPASGDNTAPFSVPACPGSAADAVPATPYCEVVASAAVPPPSVPPGTAGTTYYLHLLLTNGTVPGQSQVFNNPIPIDPELYGAVAISKTSSLTNVTKGTLVPYTITVTNVYGAPLTGISIVDRFPAGFKYVAGSARLDGNPAEPLINGRELAWNGLQLQFNQRRTIRLLLVVGSGVSEGEYVNRALSLNTTTGGAVSGEATATVRVIPDPDFDCTDVIGKVFDDANLNGEQDSGEKGLFGARVVTARGLIAATDNNGRFHITCAAVPDEDRGGNFILKLDERSLPSGYRLTTENPRVQRATRGKMLRFSFGAAIHRVVRLDIADGAFEPDTTEIRTQWTHRIGLLLEELRKGPSVLRLSYLGDVEAKGLALERLAALKKEITARWKQSGAGYQLTIETEVFWRRGAPMAGHR